MIDLDDGPNIYGVPPGADFPVALVSGLVTWGKRRRPEALARVTVFVNSARTRRRLITLFAEGPALLLPRVKLITEIGRDAVLTDIPSPVSSLRRRLELAQMVSKLLEVQSDLAPRAAAFDLAESLRALLDEMQGEGIAFDALHSLDVTDQSGHWARSLSFLKIIQSFLNENEDATLGSEARQRLAVMRMIGAWEKAPPPDPVILAGSTGSRGTTALLMEAVAKRPNGTVLLPGFDFDVPPTVWSSLVGASEAEDHPQFRFARLLERLGLSATDVHPWPESLAPDPARNRLLSLALRPAPVTDQWMNDGPLLGSMQEATKNVTLIEAPSQRSEASSIALILRNASENGRKAALVSPDRVLTRRVTAVLSRWGIVPDDSAGVPLGLTAPGRFLGQIAELMTGPITTAMLLALLKHPLVHTGSERGSHLLNTRELELWARKSGVAFIDETILGRWQSSRQRPDIEPWVAWLSRLLVSVPEPGIQTLADHQKQHFRLANAFASGPGQEGSGDLWEAVAGQTALDTLELLRREAPYGGRISSFEYETLIGSLFSQEEVRDSVSAHPRTMIWGTLEARVQGAELIVLAGLNEGTWPELPAPDPWLNRRMRKEAGLLLPDRKIGLSAHDFQQASAAEKIVLSRTIRDNDAEPVPSRWLNRFTNLLSGLVENGGPEALEEMRQRGKSWIRLAHELEAPLEMTEPAPRPAPVPPRDVRPKELPVTAIQRLIRDPYAIYSRYILGLKPLDPLIPDPGASLRGQILHRILEDYLGQKPEKDERSRFLGIVEDRLENEVPWPLIRQSWYARIERIADWFVSGEADRRKTSVFVAAELKGSLYFPEIDFRLNAIADRIDRMKGGDLVILDYKTGLVPTALEMEHFDKQLLLEALIAESGGFEGLERSPVDHVAHIGLGASMVFRKHQLEDTEEYRFATSTVKAGLVRLIQAMMSKDHGFTARRAARETRFDGDYDHLSRFGEWDMSQAPSRLYVG